ncbi:vesicle-associated membrane protein 7 [Anopheles funestus]|uniref:Vesicle-associated membrane protein 7 n=1 Tax=Anopheles funestus TaxID=62324 RepID=A0A182RYU6_ANOFN|nr:vesicle-associated membrane protein 7 [Anopheles funestus]XP_049281692.1 vesicle-associated membrane protein 7 [Anopheles funestus]XP_049281699.1 vesicle-associated membrane protein 7 [Anopheles funestus]XP_049281709.1 vesicle-associated membrane protein 7 [Anopheles funestus]
MPILFSMIARGQTVLAKYADCLGNFTEVTEQIIPNIQLLDHKLTYLHGNYLIHYICDNRIIYLCITDDKYDRSRAFLYLEDINERFICTYGLSVATAITYAMNTEFARTLAAQMHAMNESHEQDEISRVNGEIGELKDIMVKNIENITNRGERLELLVNQTENLRNNSVTFRQTSRNLARTMFWRNVRMYFLVTAILLFVIYVIVSMACGGLLWQSCINSNAPKQPPAGGL